MKEHQDFIEETSTLEHSSISEIILCQCCSSDTLMISNTKDKWKFTPGENIQAVYKR